MMIDMAKYMRERYEQRRIIAVAYLGGQCVCCGATTDLHFHHRDPKEKSFEISDKLYRMPFEKLKPELKKCELRCGKCHRLEHGWKHGTLAGFRYCKCADCRQARNDYLKEWRSRRKA